MVQPRTPADVLDELVASTNSHDLDALVDCFADDYELTDPGHPARSFTGARQVRKNWTTMFAAVPDIHIDVQQHVVTTDGFWLEAAQVGTRRDGVKLTGQMVFIASVSGGRIASAHIYVSPVETGGPDIDTVFGAMAGTLTARSGGTRAGADS
ncbi:nuclear transport factor 2 family protein [Terrabacter sp. Ter38]|uniref:nuclear transport factor 2 family protein n=1 Tax=Terrabacter sp. Ter38 TaxID=2926030 RepID=UPI0021175F62|nr:nuclear transport factor 2 family protein [Terrabacter sp. Ter38]